MNRASFTFFTASSLSLLFAISCRPATADARAPRASKAPAAETPPARNDCWWYEVGDTRLVAVWVSPHLNGEVPGGFRFVNVFFHDTADAAPISLRSSPVHARHRNAVVLEGATRKISVAPLDERSWLEVLGRKDLVVRVESR